MPGFMHHHTALAGLSVVERTRIVDERGYFSRFFARDEFPGFGTDGAIAAINQSLTRTAGSIRGLHFQRAPHDETKFVSCIRGSVFDVAVDLRPSSPTYLRWHGEVLSAENARSILIPGGFAHGFQALTDDCEMLYLHDKPFAPGFEGGLNPVDPRLAIAWPLPITLMSERDRAWPMLA